MRRARTPAERQKRRRLVKKKKAIVVGALAVLPGAIEALIDAGELAAWDANDPDAIRDALERELAKLDSVTVTA